MEKSNTANVQAAASAGHAMLRFIDLFAGLGGFHQALARLGHVCVFASESDASLAALYEKNFGVRPAGDIRRAYPDIPPHDVLCAGFPCQPFSKAGAQLGFSCPRWGDLFGYVLDVLAAHKPAYLLLENVPNLLRHDGGKTWREIESKLECLGYAVEKRKVSPEMFGVPQVRERLIVVGSRAGLEGFAWPEPTHTANEVSIVDVLDHNPVEGRALTDKEIKYLDTWQGLLDALPVGESLPSFPIWAMEFGGTYSYRGDPGIPGWKQAYIRQNREFYERHKGVIDPWLPGIMEFSPSFQKLEWNWKGGPRDLWKTVIQFRASGIRAKRPTSAPSLVALTTSQVPIIPWERRYMTIRECARLQSMGELPYLPEGRQAAHKALGNAVNVDVIATVAGALLSLHT